jgi:site-specific DNA-methyltransferase (adenine-specific)
VKPYYEADGITIYHGDCREILPTLKADVVVTDPPYGIDLHAGYNAGQPRANYLHKGSYDSYEDTIDNLRTIVVPSVTRALEKAKAGVVFCAPTRIREFPEPVSVGGVYLPSGCGRTAWGFTNFALCLLYGKCPHTHRGCRHTVLRSTEGAEPNGHPCNKPFGWMRFFVNLASTDGDVILDPFMGSGTTLVAAKLEGRRAIGVEIEERYCEIAAKRLAQGVLSFEGSL